MIVDKIDWWESRIMRKLFDEKIDWWESQLMRKLIDEKVDWWERWMILGFDGPTDGQC